MHNFEIIDTKRFSINGKIYPRNCFIHIKGDGGVSVINLINNQIIVDNIFISDILINNEAIEDLEILRRVIFNRVCQCGGVSKPGKIRLFNRIFDEKFN